MMSRRARVVLLSIAFVVPLGATRAQLLLRDVETARTPTPPSSLTGSVNGLAWFTVPTPEHGAEPWLSDGTPAGTTMLADLNPGLADSSAADFEDLAGTTVFTTSTPAALWASDGTPGSATRLYDGWVRDATRLGGEVWFVTSGGVRRTDGTAAGTTLVLPTPIDTSNASFVELGGHVWFSRTDPPRGHALWRSDGTTTGTTVVATFSRIQRLAASDRFVFAITGDYGEQLWRSDGTATGTALVRYFIPTVEGGVTGMTGIGDRLYFSYPDPAFGREPWVTDGFASSMVRDVRPGKAGSMQREPFVALSGDALFVADDGSGSRIWRTDGTSAGTARFGQVGATNGYNVLAVGARVYFSGLGSGGVEPWVSDGTPAGELRLGDLAPGTAWSSPHSFRLAGSTVYFVANTAELWRTDGTTAGTVFVRRFDRGIGSGIGGAMRVGRRLVFHATTTSENALWTSDGTTSGTTRLMSFSPQHGLQFGASVGDVVVFGGDSPYGYGPWRTDGTLQGTLLLLDASPVGPRDPRLFVSLGDRVVFVASSARRLGIWCTDGTRAETRLVQDVGEAGATTTASATLDGRAYLAVNGLWTTDGTSAGTARLSTLLPRQLGASAGFVYFDGADELYRTDGTIGGTTLVSREARSPGSFTDVAGSLFFTATHALTGHELWTSDGTAAGTVVIKDVRPGPDPSGATHLLALDRGLFFVANDGVHGYEPWVSDGTTAGTRLLRDIWPGAGSGVDHTRAPFPIDDHRVVFAADDGVHGRELWVTDGTAAGTRLAADVVPGPAQSVPAGFATVASADGGALLFFVAEHQYAGREPYVLHLGSLGASVTETYGAGCAAAPRVAPSLRDEGRPSLGRADFALVGRASASRPCAVLVSASPRSFAMPGDCTLLVGSGVFVAAATDANGVARVPMPVPDDVLLLGLRVFSQFAVVVPGGALSGVIDLSHGHVALVGRD